MLSDMQILTAERRKQADHVKTEQQERFRADLYPLIRRRMETEPPKWAERGHNHAVVYSIDQGCLASWWLYWCCPCLFQNRWCPCLLEDQGYIELNYGLDAIEARQQAKEVIRQLSSQPEFGFRVSLDASDMTVRW